MKYSRNNTGPFIFEFQRTGIDPKDFLPHFDQFLGQLPERYEYAVEVRNPGVLGGSMHLYSGSMESAISIIISMRCHH
jgi:hypothetical protein